MFDLNGSAYDSKPRSAPNMLGAMVASGLFGKEIKCNPEIHDIIRDRDRPALLRGDDHDATIAPANSTRNTEDYFQYGTASSHLHVAAAEGHVNSVRSADRAARVCASHAVCLKHFNMFRRQRLPAPAGAFSGEDRRQRLERCGCVWQHSAPRCGRARAHRRCRGAA